MGRIHYAHFRDEKTEAWCFSQSTSVYLVPSMGQVCISPLPTVGQAQNGKSKNEDVMFCSLH